MMTKVVVRFVRLVVMVVMLVRVSVWGWGECRVLECVDCRVV